MAVVSVIWRGLLAVAFGLSIVVGLAVLCVQIFTWAKTGEWMAVPLARAFAYYGVDLSLVYNAQDWKGLAGAATWLLSLPLFLMAPVIGLLVCIAAKRIDPFGLNEN